MDVFTGASLMFSTEILNVLFNCGKTKIKKIKESLIDGARKGKMGAGIFLFFFFFWLGNWDFIN